jgi:polysaccharide pyruvyl transferase WcaK-like protein
MSMASLRDLLPAKPLLVVGGYGYRNAGDEAILSGLLRLTGRDGVTVVSRMPGETSAIHDVASVPIRRAPAALARSRGLVIGGGGLFGSHMGLLGRTLPLAGLTAAFAGREVALLGIGVDRDMPRTARLPLGVLGRRASAVVVRDNESRSVLAQLGVQALVAPDLSSLVESAGARAGRAVLEAAGLRPDRRPVVGLAVTAVEPALWERAEPGVLAAVDAHPDVDFAIVPMSRHPWLAAHNDEVLAGRLVAARPRLRVVVPPDDTSQVLGLFDALRAVVAMRYHSLFFAERAGIPIVPVAYAEKCRHWLDERGLTAVQPSAEAINTALSVALQATEPVGARGRRVRVAA